MGKGHKDNHRARKKRGSVAFEKKAQRRNSKKRKCHVCGAEARPETFNSEFGHCKPCEDRYFPQE